MVAASNAVHGRALALAAAAALTALTALAGAAAAAAAAVADAAAFEQVGLHGATAATLTI